MGRRFFDALEIGDVIVHELRRTVTETDNLLITTLTHTPQPLPLDPAYAAYAAYAAGTELGRSLVDGIYTFGREERT